MSVTVELTPDILARRSLFVFDEHLEDLSVLQGSLKPQDASLRVTRNDDFVLDLTMALRTLRCVNELVLVGYGRPGELAVGLYGFGTETLGIYADLIASWKHHLTDDAKIVLVGAAVGAGRDGADFADRLSALTDRQVIAPIFTVGAGSWNFGGDWAAPDGWQSYRGEL